MNDETIELHPSAGAAGAIGAAGELGANAAGAERQADPVAPALGFKLAPFVATNAEAQLVQALVNAGYAPAEAETLALAAIAELERRKSPAVVDAAEKGK